MPNKKHCKKCDAKHVPPVGRNCKIAVETVDEDNANGNELYRDAAVSSEASGMAFDGQRVQLQILQQLEKVTKRLEKVEDRMTTVSPPQKLSTSKLSTSSVMSSVRKVKSKRKSCVYTDSSSDSDTPSLDVLRSPQLQKRVDRRIRELTHSSHCTGTDSCEKFKSKRGGNVDVTVKKKVAWPHETILGGASRQRINYDQLSLTQWVNGFCKNILDEPSVSRRDAMVSYMGDLMEDASDFSWQGAKAAHAVLLCEMERGKVDWGDQDRIDRIRRAYAQKHVVPGKQNWVKPNETSKKPWFCKSFQSGICGFQKDHESNGRLHRHICAYCLSTGKQLGHAEKDCAHKKNASKNDAGAASH